MTNSRCRSVRGHLTNKSTAFSPDGKEFGCQSLIHDHMMMHYRRIDNAKSSIDNKPPKCMDTFIKVHTKKVRLKKENERKSANDELRRSQMDQPQIVSFNEKAILHSSSKQFTYDDDYDDRQFLKSTQTLANTFDTSRENVLDSFVQPRSNKTTTYKPSSEISVRKQPTTPRHRIEMYEPDQGPIPIRGSLFNVNQIENRDLRPTSRSFGLSSANIYSSSPKPGRSPENLLSNSTNLEISQVRFGDTGNAWSNGIVSYRQPSYMESQRLDLSMMSLNEQLSHTQTSAKYDNRELPIYEVSRLQKQEELIAEEQLYLQFIEEVTTDILARGIFSDRVLKQVFDAHLEKRRGQLNEGRMRAMINELKEDLKVEEDTNK